VSALHIRSSVPHRATEVLRNLGSLKSCVAPYLHAKPAPAGEIVTFDLPEAATLPGQNVHNNRPRSGFNDRCAAQTRASAHPVSLNTTFIFSRMPGCGERALAPIGAPLPRRDKFTSPKAQPLCLRVLLLIGNPDRGADGRSESLRPARALLAPWQGLVRRAVNRMAALFIPQRVLQTMIGKPEPARGDEPMKRSPFILE
jgi:hypothetical protein